MQTVLGVIHTYNPRRTHRCTLLALFKSIDNAFHIVGTASVCCQNAALTGKVQPETRAFYLAGSPRDLICALADHKEAGPA